MQLCLQFSVYTKVNLKPYFKMRRIYSYLFVLVSVITISSCSKQDVEPTVASTEQENLIVAGKCKSTSSIVATEWMQLIRTIVQSEGKNPPQASRIYAYSAIGLYEATVPGMGGYRSLENQIPGLVNLPRMKNFSQIDFTLAANEVLFQISSKIFVSLKQTNMDAVEALRKKYMDAAIQNLRPKQITETLDFAQKVALAVINRADNDNFASTRALVYIVPSNILNPSYWTPTGAVTIPVEPYWGTLKCFSMANGAACTIPSTIPFSTTPSSDFYNQAADVVSITSTLTQGQKDIANWWADGGGTPTPPGHWIGIASNIANAKQMSLESAAEMYAKLNIAMADAFISCWNEKYRINLLRPLSYIRTYIPGQSTWSSYIPTPPFPEYPSGHSVASGAASNVLTNILGSFPFTDSTNKVFGYAPRNYNSFFDAANEAAMSRLYGGIHFREAIEKGLLQGKEVSKALDMNIRFRR